MAKFQGISKLSEVTQQAAPVSVNAKKRSNNTSGRMPKTIRFTEQEEHLLQLWITELQQNTNRRLSTSKVLRGLIHMKDDINQDELLQSILENV